MFMLTFQNPLVYDQYDKELNHGVGLQFNYDFRSCFEHTFDIFNTCQNEGCDKLIESIFVQPV